ncbi:Clavaminate synthase-like protein [Gigaspora margarita]|uniref:Clavaminate synthase-like protein n=1 Tax=Gigaspora margarita TaxID=4874 RepID=A0A8H3X5F3_GIGMA|nr:Clavaminate synthase-like protein [Gigaspora margarita]
MDLMKRIKFDDNDDLLAQILPPLFNEKNSLFSSLSKKCHQLCLKILQTLAIALEIPQSEGGKHCYSLSSNGINNDHQEDIRAGRLWFVDCPFPKDIGGLEILPHNSTEWVPVPIISNCVVINVADCLQFWSKEQVMIITNEFKQYSKSAKSDRIPSKLIPQNDDNTKYITAGEHLQNKLNAAYQKFY